MRRLLLPLLAAAPLVAEEPIEVRRALPANAPDPAWMDRVPPEIRRAEPVHPISAPSPVPTASPQNIAPEVDLAPPATGEDDGIRIAPSTEPDEAGATLARANNFYARKLHELAVPEYEKFLHQ